MARRKPVQREKGEQAAIVQLLRAIGADVYVLGTRRSSGRNCPHCRTFVPNHDMSTRQTPGIPDLYVVLPKRRLVFIPDMFSQRRPDPPREKAWIEVKAAGGVASEAQKAFKALCEESETPHILGGLDDVVAWLVAECYLKDTQVPYYRLRKEA